MLPLVYKYCSNYLYEKSNEYTGDSKFTAIIQNHNRPEMAESLVINMLNNEHIDQVILLQSKYETFLKLEHPRLVKVDAVESDQRHGLRNRFYYAHMAKNEYLLYIDDDMIPSEKCISVLLNKVVNDPKIIHGIYGRNLEYTNMYWDDFATQLHVQREEKEVEIVLTKILATTKYNAWLFEKYQHLVENVALHGVGTKWNGEDIFLSMITMYANGGRKNKVYCLNHSWLVTKNGISNNGGHTEYRKNFIKYIKKHLRIVDVIGNSNSYNNINNDNRNLL